MSSTLSPFCQYLQQHVTEPVVVGQDRYDLIGEVILTEKIIAEEYWFDETIVPGVYWIGLGCEGPTMPYRERDECEDALWTHYYKNVRKGYIS